MQRLAVASAPSGFVYMLPLLTSTKREEHRVLIGEPTCNGELTHVDLEIAGEVRRVAVTRKAIEDKLGAAAGMSPEAMCDFVRSNLPKVQKAVRRRLSALSETAYIVMIRTGSCGRPPSPHRPYGSMYADEREKFQKRRVNGVDLGSSFDGDLFGGAPGGAR